MTNVDYRGVLEDLGYKLNDHGSYWTSTAVFRSGDNPNAIQIYKDSGVWKDYVEDSIFLPFKVLVEKTVGTKDKIIIKSYLKEDGVNIYKRERKRNLLKEEKTYPDRCLKRLLPHYDFYLKKGISKETLESFRCGLAMSGKMYQRVTFPISRSDGRICGFSGRISASNTNKPKWIHIGRSANWFYPYYSIEEVKKEIEKKRSVHIVESIGDGLALFDSGVKNVLVSFGLNISPKFIARLAGLSLDKIFISFNNDFLNERNRGVEGAVKSIFKLCDQVDFERIYFSPPTENDFGSMDREQINKYVEYCGIMSHNDSMENVLEIALEMNKSSANKSFASNLRKFQKKYNFTYGEI